jgi:head-tail adaptor
VIYAGLMRTVVGIQPPTDTTDQLGRPNPTWTTRTYMRAEVKDQGALETEWGGGPAVVRTFDLMCRWGTVQKYGLNERFRLEFDGRTCAIVSITDVKNLHRYARIRCVEVVP